MWRVAISEYASGVREHLADCDIARVRIFCLRLKPRKIFFYLVIKVDFFLLNQLHDGNRRKGFGNRSNPKTCFRSYRNFRFYIRVSKAFLIDKFSVMDNTNSNARNPVILDFPRQPSVKNFGRVFN